MDPEKSNSWSRIKILLKILFGLVFLMFLELVFCFHYHPVGTSRMLSINNARGIAESWSSSGGDAKWSANVCSICELAALIAEKGGLNDPSFWLLPFDPLVGDSIMDGKIPPKNIIEKTGGSVEINSAFKDFCPSWSAVNGLGKNVPPMTPILWTRGLRSDGKWDRGSGVFGGIGGHIVFADKSARWFDSLKDKDHPDGVLFKYGTRKPTFNIYEAIPGGRESVLNDVAED